MTRTPWESGPAGKRLRLRAARLGLRTTGFEPVSKDL